jgi:hypothetical protein
MFSFMIAFLSGLLPGGALAFSNTLFDRYQLGAMIVPTNHRHIWGQTPRLRSNVARFCSVPSVKLRISRTRTKHSGHANCRRRA